MRIVLLPAPEGDVIAREEQFGRLEAEFVLAQEMIRKYKASQSTAS
jgi:hypothetical protein